MPFQSSISIKETYHLSLDDVVKDVFRRQYFLNAFPNEKDTLETCFGLLTYVRKYKQLSGQKDILRNVAEEIFNRYLSNKKYCLCAHIQSEEMTQFIQRINQMIRNNICTLDMFSGIEKHVKDCVKNEKFFIFLKSQDYEKLCEAIRCKRDLELAEVLVEKTRSRFLQQFLETYEQHSSGNLLFWMDVQILLLPLIQANSVTPALLDEIHSTARKIFNTYLAQSAKHFATLIPESTRKETLARILQLQGEPFSSPRYANLFRVAQDKVWEWLQGSVFPEFKKSSIYIQLVVEIENLETDLQLREHFYDQLNNTSLVLPVSQRESTMPIIEHLLRRDYLASFTTSLALPELQHHDIEHILFYSVRSNLDPDTGFAGTYSEKLSKDHVIYGDEDTPLYDPLDFCWEQLYTGGVMSPSYRPNGVVPKSSIDDFVIPSEKKIVYGCCLKIWKQATMMQDVKEIPLNVDEKLTSSAIPVLPRLIIILTKVPRYTLSRRIFKNLCHPDRDVISEQLLTNVVTHAAKAHDDVSFELTLNHMLDAFCLGQNLPFCDQPIQWLFKELSVQTVLFLMSALLLEKSILLVSQRVSQMTLVSEALLKLLFPFVWKHFYIPFAPGTLMDQLIKEYDFASRKKPFFIGIEGIVSHLKTKDGSDYKYRIRNSMYNVQKVSLQIYPSCKSNSRPYPCSILSDGVIVVDLEMDDVYVPERTDALEFPPMIRQLEATIKDITENRMCISDSKIFIHTAKHLPRVFHENISEKKYLPTKDVGTTWSINAGIRLAFMSFFQMLFGDVIYYFCSFNNTFVGKGPTQNEDKFLIFEMDAFLEAHVELECRDFFRHFFETEMFHDYLVRQHVVFCPSCQHKKK